MTKTKTKHTRHNLTALIYDKRGFLLSIGKNSYTKSHPLMKEYSVKAGTPDKIYLHAEIDALIRLSKISGRKPAHIHVMRIGKDGKERNAKPCPACMMAIASFGITKITHT